MIITVSHMINKLDERLNTRYSHWLISELKAIRLSEINHRRKKLGKGRREHQSTVENFKWPSTWVTTLGRE